MDNIQMGKQTTEFYKASMPNHSSIDCLYAHYNSLCVCVCVSEWCVISERAWETSSGVFVWMNKWVAPPKQVPDY